jgi:hypothetical protein
VSTDDKDLIDEGLRTLSDGEAQAEAAEHAALEELAQRVEEPGLQDKILDRYMSFGRDLLSDQLPSHLDPRIIKRLEPILGDMSAVRVHTGATATAAARATALIAHELAHARDASTGFALSSKQGSQTSDREAFAEAVESRVFAMEDDSLEGAAKSIESVAAPNDPANRAESTVDKEALSRRVWEILEAQQRSGRDRHGR